MEMRLQVAECFFGKPSVARQALSSTLEASEAKRGCAGWQGCADWFALEWILSAKWSYTDSKVFSSKLVGGIGVPVVRELSQRDSIHGSAADNLLAKVCWNLGR